MLNKVAVVIVLDSLNTLGLQITEKLIANGYFVFVLCNDKCIVEKYNVEIQDALFIYGESNDNSKLELIYSAIEDDLNKIDLLINVTEFDHNESTLRLETGSCDHVISNSLSCIANAVEIYSAMLKNSSDASVINILKIPAKNEAPRDSVNSTTNSIAIYDYMKELCNYKTSIILI